MSRRTAARVAVIRAALVVLAAEHEDAPHAYSDAESEYADEQLALAARELTTATEQLPPDERPVGWHRAPSAQPHRTLRRPDGHFVVLDEVLALPLAPNDTETGANSVRGYLTALLARLWREGESFSGKHPFGNSGWRWDLYPALERAGYVAGVMRGGYVRPDADPAAVQAYDDLIAATIEHLGNT